MTNFTSRYIDLFLSHSNPVGSLLTRLVFSRTELHEADRARLQRCAEGIPLYVMRTSNDLDFLLLMSVLRREGLPEPVRVLPGESMLIRPVNGLTDMAGRLLLGLGESHQAKLLAETLLSGDAALLALFSSGTFFTPEERPRSHKALVNIFSRLTGAVDLPPVYAVPVVPVWDKSGVRRSLDQWGLLDKYLGSQESPKTTRAALQLATSMLKPVIKIGEPVELTEFLQSQGEAPIEESTQLLRDTLIDSIEKEWQTILGPKLKHKDMTKRELSRSPDVTDAYFEAVDSGISPRQALREIREAITAIPAAPTSTTLALYKHALRFLWYRIFRGFELDDEGFLALRETQKKGPLLLLPCHRSHIDYLILSWLMDSYHLPIPHIAAGENLSFFPMGPIFRRGGAFFIKRTFKGNKLYKTVLLEYLAGLFHDGINVEFFIEGTRSRTGKVVYPKQGLLSMIGELLAHKKIPSPQLVPIAIGYEKVIEETSYQAELKGESKKSEDFLQVLKAGKVILNRYGRVNIRVAEPFDMAAYLGDVAPGTPRFNEKIERMALKVIHEIVKNTLVTASMITAAALLSTGENTLHRAEVFSRFTFFRRVAIEQGANLSKALLNEETFSRRFDRALRGFSDICTVRGDRITLKPSGRIRLAYYRNGLSQIIAPLSIYALASRFGVGDYVMHSFLFKALWREFPHLNLLDMENAREASMEYFNGLSDTNRNQLGHLVVDLVEGQCVAFDALVSLFEKEERRYTKKELVKAIIEHGERALQHGLVSRPECLSRSIYQEVVQALLLDGVLVSQERQVGISEDKGAQELDLRTETHRKFLAELSTRS